MQLSDLKGLGPKRLEALGAAGIHTPADLLWNLPMGYRDTTQCLPIALVQIGRLCCIEIRFEEKPRVQYARGLSIVRAQTADETGAIQMIWFNQPWNANNFKRGDQALFYGRAEQFKGKLTMQNPQLVKERGLVPHYSPIGIVAGKTLAEYIRQTLPLVVQLVPETLPDTFRLRHNLCDISYALTQAHRPESAQSLDIAKRRIAFENLLIYQLALRALQGSAQEGIRLTASNGLIERFWRQTGFEPTRAQRRVLDEVLGDLGSGRAMRRMIQGDVGSGKTAVAFGAVCIAARGGYQTALMVPTEILAHQHFESAHKTLEPLGISCGLLLGGMKAAERKQALQHIRMGDWQLVIGTHALFSQGVDYANLGLVITDEQHRFGVRQRQKLSLKVQGEQVAHVLVMSATPIPRTLALILYGDLDVSILDEMPPGRLPVQTRIVPEHKRAQMYAFIRDKALAGEQSYLVCPLVEESEQVEAKDAQAMYEQLRRGPLKGLRLGLTYGSQPSQEKETVMGRFSAGDIDVLVATTVIEVGVNVPKATTMVIENAERFGLSQLHQLRGRVGRSAQESWCFLLGQPNERLTTLCATHDGFVIAQKDLELRGPGDFLGTRQHGRILPDAYGIGDVKLIEESRAAVHELTHSSSYAQEEAQLNARAIEKYAKAMAEIALQ